MNKKLFSILFIIFLVGILSVSCSNKDKTGSGSNTKIDSTYKGNWWYMDNNDIFITVKDDGNVVVHGLESQAQEIAEQKIEGSGNSYTLTVTYIDPTAPILKYKIKFTDSNRGTVVLSQIGTNFPDYSFDIVKR